MDYKLNVKKKSSQNFSVVDLFADSIINFDLDFYDVDNIDKIKVPINVSLSLPMTSDNVAIIDYDPTSASYNTLPTTPFDFELYVDNNKVLEGNLYVESYAFNNTIPTINIRLVDRIQEIFKDLQDASFETMYDDYNTLTSFNQFLSQYSGTLNTEPTKNDILFPYVDFCNDVDRFDYAARQFMQFGFDSDKVGIVPAYKVSGFIERFFNQANVGVTSRFFELGNYGTSLTNNNPDDLYMLLNSKMHAGSRTRTRGFYLVEGEYEHFINEYTFAAEFPASSAKENEDYPAQTYGWNYNPTPFANPTDNDYGLTYRTNEPNDGTEVDKAYFGSHMNYMASPYADDLFTGNPRNLTSGSWVGMEIPLIKDGANGYSVVKGIDTFTSDAVFNIVSTLWVDGVPKDTFRMCNTDGSVKELSIQDALVFQITDDTAKNLLVYDEYDPQSGAYFPHWERVYIGPTAPTNGLNNYIRFYPSAIGDFQWEQKEIEIQAGSTYAVSLSFEWLEGSLDVEYVTSWQNHPTNIYDFHGWAIPDQTATKTIKKEDVSKAVYREDPNNIGQLYLAFASNGTHNPYFLDDDVNVYWIQQYSDVNVYDTVKEIIARFNLSVVYDQNTQTVLIDRLQDIRELNATQDITDKIDDAQEIKVDVSSRVAKSIDITTSNKGLFYDTYGYNKVDVNTAGTDDLKFNLNSRFYNESLCGPVVVDFYDGGYLSDNEIGFTSNEFSKYTSIGITFGYISQPLYTTNIKRAKFIDKSFYKGIVYDTLTTHVFPRFIKYKSGSMPLNHFDENGNPTALYDFFVGNDNVLYYDKPKVVLTSLINKEYAFDIKNNYSVVDIAFINNNGIIIKSVAGQLFESGIYGEVEAIIL